MPADPVTPTVTPTVPPVVPTATPAPAPRYNVSLQCRTKVVGTEAHTTNGYDGPIEATDALDAVTKALASIGGASATSIQSLNVNKAY